MTNVVQYHKVVSFYDINKIKHDFYESSFEFLAMRDLSIHSGTEELREECPRIHNQDQIHRKFLMKFQIDWCI